MDDSEEVIDSLDTLWFFSNIFSSKTPHNLASIGDDDDDGDIHSTTPITLKSKPISIPMNLNTHHPPISEILVRNSIPNCVEVFRDTLPEKAKTEPIKVPESSGTQQHRNRRASKARKMRNFDGTRRILGEIDLGEDAKNSENIEFDDVKRVYGCWIVEENHGSGRKMPPFHDGFAMKKHLKYWAYAVACTVK